MAITYRYVDWPGGAFDEDLGSSVRLGSISGLSEVAAIGEVGTSDIAFDDPDGDLGYSGDEIRGWKLLFIEDDEAPVGNRVLYAGIIGDRDYQQADSLVTGAQRRITVTLRDLNALVDLRELRGTTWRRKAETAEARLTALLASPYFSGITDQGLVVYPKHLLDPADYRGQRPSNVLTDIVKGLNWNWWVRWNESAEAPELYLNNSNRSSAFASTLRLTDLVTDRDSDPDFVTQVGATGTFAVDGKPKLNRSPENVYSGVGVPGTKLTYYEEDATIAALFIARDGSAPDANTRTTTQARRIARRYLANSKAETDRIETAVIVPAAEVNSIRAGHLIEARFREFPAYSDFSHFRVVRRAVAQPMKIDDRYRIPVTLSPATPFSCIGLSDVNEAHGTVSAGWSVLSGLVTKANATFDNHWFDMPADGLVSDVVVANPSAANDGDASTYAGGEAFAARHAGTVAEDFTATLDGDYILCSTKGTVEVGSSSWRSRPPTFIEYWDGSAWQHADGSLLYAPSTPAPCYWTFTFSEPITTSKLRWRYLFSTTTTSIAELWFPDPLGTRVYDMQLIGAAV